MFARVSQTTVSAVLLFTVFATATPTPQSTGDCNTGPVECCQETQTVGAGGPITAIIASLGLVLDPNTLVGAECSPITVIGAGQSGCSANPVCCENNNVGGLISIGCVPVSL